MIKFSPVTIGVITLLTTASLEGVGQRAYATIDDEKIVQGSRDRTELVLTSGSVQIQPTAWPKLNPIAPPVQAVPVKPLTGLGKDEDQLNDLLTQGREQVDADDLVGAIATYRQASTLDDSNPLIFSAIGYLESSLGNYTEAITAYQQAIALDADEPRFHYALGYALAQSGQYAAAEAAYQEVVRLDAKNLNAFLGLGATQFRQDRYDDALVTYERALALAPNNLQIEGFLGSTLLQLGRYSEAIEIFERVTARMPNDLNAHINLGTALLNVGRDEEAFAAFDRAERLNSGDGQLLFDLGQLLEERGDEERSTRYYRRAANLDNSPELQLSIGQALLNNEDPLYAILALREAISLNPESAEAHVSLAAALNAQNRQDEAITELEQARSLYETQGQSEKVVEINAMIEALN
ncbi:MAG: tetratricopeptide repeat protein [Oscillatoriales cyanobacterium]|nr:MAG: tetratricopeptide repeat protein [Oscillatoriales cyanobacterium]